MRIIRVVLDQTGCQERLTFSVPLPDRPVLPFRPKIPSNQRNRLQVSMYAVGLGVVYRVPARQYFPTTSQRHSREPGQAV